MKAQRSSRRAKTPPASERPDSLPAEYGYLLNEQELWVQVRRSPDLALVGRRIPALPGLAFAKRFRVCFVLGGVTRSVAVPVRAWLAGMAAAFLPFLRWRVRG